MKVKLSPGINKFELFVILNLVNVFGSIKGATVIILFNAGLCRIRVLKVPFLFFNKLKYEVRNKVLRYKK